MIKVLYMIKTGMKVKKVNLMILIIVKLEVNIHLKMEQSLMDNGKIIIDMDKERKFGQMAQSMKASGRITKLMAKVLSGMYMATFMRAIGKEIKLTEKENIHIKTVPHTKVTGKMICNME